MRYADLTPTQQENAQHDLFHDALFSVDSTEFDYVVEHGVVTGRLAPKLEKNRKQVRNQPVVLLASTARNIDDGSRYVMECVINDLARAVALRMVSQVSCTSVQTQE
jgi:hypothetical protein